jgi:hypothetical protein
MKAGLIAKVGLRSCIDWNAGAGLKEKAADPMIESTG